jgi:DNA-binding GntR family transcriptional regulator
VQDAADTGGCAKLSTGSARTTTVRERLRDSWRTGERTTVSPRDTAWGTYTKIADILRERIASERLAPGSLLPSEARLCEEFTVVRNTVRRALAAIEDEGLIETLPGKGRVVRGGAPTQYEYRRIAADLRVRIENGDLAPGDALPSEATLVDTYGVARGTARAALASLESEGLVDARHGKGRFVRRRT